MGNVAAFYDIDGTLFREALSVELFKKLTKNGIVSNYKWLNEVKPIYDKWVNREACYDDYIDKLFVDEVQDKYLVTINVNEEYKMIRKINANINGKDYYAKYDNGIATVEIDKNVNSILLIKVTMQCVPQNVIEDIEERDFKLMATPDVFYSNAISTISSYIDNFYK